jgi:hypothetical protein
MVETSWHLAGQVRRFRIPTKQPASRPLNTGLSSSICPNLLLLLFTNIKHSRSSYFQTFNQPFQTTRLPYPKTTFTNTMAQPGYFCAVMRAQPGYFCTVQKAQPGYFCTVQKAQPGYFCNVMRSA